VRSSVSPSAPLTRWNVIFQRSCHTDRSPVGFGESGSEQIAGNQVNGYLAENLKAGTRVNVTNCSWNSIHW
jgi:hypothetical protein